MPGLSAAFERIGSALEHHLPVSHAGGIALAVTDREEILGVAVRGFADAAAGLAVKPETRFQIGSISKSFAAAVAMQEAEEGRLDLHASVNELLPWLELPEPFGPITTHHLLTHSAGLITGTEDAPTVWGAVANLRRIQPSFPPGERFWYSNDGYKLVGLVLEHVTGLAIQDLLRARILAPLQMASSQAVIVDETRSNLATGYQPLYSDRPPQLTHALVPATWIESNTADGSIVSDVVDMSAYARFLLNAGDGPNGRVLSEAGFAELTARRIAEPDDPYADYAYGLSVEKPGAPNRLVGHTGGMVGYTAHLLTLPDEGLGCVVLQNGFGNLRAVVEYGLAAVGASLAGAAPPSVPIPRDPQSHPGASGFVGTYTGERRAFEVVREGEDRLRLKIGPLGVLLEQDPLSRPGDTFLVPHPSLDRFALAFGRDARGEVVEAFHGDEWFRGERWTEGEPPAPPGDVAAYLGRYRSNDPWAPVLQVTLRKSALHLAWPSDPDEGGDLVPQADGSYAVGESWTPRRLRFEEHVGGKAAVAVYNGGRWYRSFED